MPAVREELMPVANKPANGWIVFRGIYMNQPAVRETLKDFPSTERLGKGSVMAAAIWDKLSSEIKKGYKQIGIDNHKRELLEWEQALAAGGQAPVGHGSRRRRRNRKQRPQTQQAGTRQDFQIPTHQNFEATSSSGVARPPFAMAQGQSAQQRVPEPQQNLPWNQSQVIHHPHPTYPPQHFAGANYQHHVFPQAPISYYRRDQGAQISVPDGQLQITHYAHQAPITPDEDWTPASSPPRPQGYFWQAQDGQQLEQAAPYYEAVSNEIPVSAAPDNNWSNNTIANFNVPNTMNNTVNNYAASEFWPPVGAEYNAPQLPTPPEPFFSNSGHGFGNIHDNTLGDYDGQAFDYANFDYFAAPTAAPVQLTQEDWDKICAGEEEEEEEEEEEINSDPDLVVPEIVASTQLSQENAAPRFEEEEESLEESENAIANSVEDTKDADLPVSQDNAVQDLASLLFDFGENFPDSNEVSSFDFPELTPSSAHQPPDPAYFQEVSYQEWTSGEAFVYR